MAKTKFEFEECILCRAQTDVPKEMAVDERKNYMHGVGQMCSKCFAQMQKEMAQSGQVTESEINTIMRLCLDKDDDGYQKPAALIRE